METLIENIESLLQCCDSSFSKSETEEILYVVREILEIQRAALDECGGRY